MDTGTRTDIPGFKLKEIHNLKMHAEKCDGFIPESDLSLQSGDYLLQYNYHKVENQHNLTIKPGCYNLTKSLSGVDIAPTEFIQKDILTTILNTTAILNEANVFFNKLNVYEELNQPKRRGVILYSEPGMGKTASIVEIVKQLKNEDPGTVVINWPTAEIEASSVFKFFTSYSEYTTDCTRLILIIEDLGSHHEGYSRRDEVSSSLLNLLDGVNNVFKLPTFILATTNFPQNLLNSLIDRPARFDLVMEVLPPKYEDRLALVEFIAKRPLIEEEKNALQIKGIETFSIAHLQEIVIRSRLHDKSLEQVIKELIKHKEKYKNDFESPKKKTGFRSSLDDIFDD
jgi:DNA replication protein DnaC